jgi:hypothetical protein
MPNSEGGFGVQRYIKQPFVEGDEEYNSNQDDAVNNTDPVTTSNSIDLSPTATEYVYQFTAK